MMLPTSAAALLSTATTALIVMAALQLPAAATPPPGAPVGLPGCDITCGNLSVPYPFGLGPSRCYRPGFNLTCDRSHRPPRLLLGDGTLRVTEISLENRTVRVVRTGGSIINATGDFTSDGWSASFGRGFKEYGYMLSHRNELVVFGCNVVAKLLGDIGDEGGKAPATISGCASFCPWTDRDGGALVQLPNRDSPWELTETTRNNMLCSGTASRCCLTPLILTSRPDQVQAKWLYSGNHTAEQMDTPVNVFIVEEGWFDMNGLAQASDLVEAPLLLEWEVVTGGVPGKRSCSDSEDIGRMICKSKHSYSWPGFQKGCTCRCHSGYDGNPYLAGGCQDINECELPKEESSCFGECINTIGSFECRCPRGTYGYPGVKDGCIKGSFSTALMVAPAAQIGLPNCDTTCGSVHVPYPFGISHGCYLPGFNLICNTSYDPPQLLLENNRTLQIVGIFLQNSTMRVIHTTTFPDHVIYQNGIVGNMEDFIHLPHISDPYMLSSSNEFIITGCGLRATLHGEYRNGSSSNNTTDTGIISECVSTCSSNMFRDHGARPPALKQTHGRYCSGRDGCCHAPIFADSRPKKVDIKINSSTTQENYRSWNPDVPYAFISEEGLTDRWYTILNRSDLWATKYLSSPLVLRWVVKHGFPSPADNSAQCPGDVASNLCKSEHSNCRQEDGGFTCYCSTGYQGNPYITNGCQDECNITAAAIGNPCFGRCNKLPGGRFECLCPRGTHGNPFVHGGCIRFPLGLIIGLSIASGPVLLLLVMGMILVYSKIKQRKIKILKQKYFKQNRGQLLQQLMSQKADIAERMIIPVDELAKATNNFDKARELGGGGHGTVYKGILSDLHVVAIKKSKITVQKEIDEFINEVAILSQINHKNVVKLFGCCLETEVPLLVYEFISNGTLYHHLHVEGPRSLSWGNRLRIATEIATSLAYLHAAVSIPIIHRDIKSSNILLDDTLTAKVSDFGASRYIPVEKTGLTTRVQGTIGYLDPMYFYTSRLTEKSDVYSFGVILVELLTRKNPVSYLSTEGDGLVSHFVNLLAEGNLVQIIDPQVKEEGDEDIHEVAALAASCINLRGEERPTMRQVEHSLEGLRGSKMHKKDDMVAVDYDSGSTVINCITSTEEGQRFQESSRRYSLEQEMMMSSRYPR